MDLLTVSPENRLRKQVAEQDYTIQTRMKEKDEQIEDLRREVEEIKTLLRNSIMPKQMRDE